MSNLILHHYPQSPVAEKVRVGLGIKGLSWHSVEIPRLPPKPDLMPLTGGFRRTPVMQIGADIFCDSQRILLELEQRFPEPGFFPGGTYTGLGFGISRWTDGEFFDQVIKLVLGAPGDALPKDFGADRGRLYFGPDWQDGLKRAHEDLPHILSQLRGHLAWLNQRLNVTGAFVSGERPGMPDAHAYFPIWFIRGRWPGGPDFLAEFPALVSWERRIADIGHGNATNLTAVEALEIARTTAPEPPSEPADETDPQGLAPGRSVTVAPDVDGGEAPVAGTIRALSAHTICIARTDPRVGNVAVHFPRVGYRVTPE